MECYQHIRLRQHYEAALRRWEQIERNTSANRLAAEVKSKALEERNAAKERMILHKQSCLICSRTSKSH